MNLSLGLRPLTISYTVNRACPPSRPGTGKIFMNASMIEKTAVSIQKLCQSHSEGKMPPILITLPKESLALISFDVKICLRLVMYFVRVDQHFLKPAGIDSRKL